MDKDTFTRIAQVRPSSRQAVNRFNDRTVDSARSGPQRFTIFGNDLVLCFTNGRYSSEAEARTEAVFLT